MAGVLIATLVAIGALVWVVLYVLREETDRREQIDKELHGDEVPTLEYSVPTGQDPVGILAALEREGYTATVDPSGAHQIVMVGCPEGLDRHRARVRAAIQSASATTQQHGIPLQLEVRFRDEE